MAARAKKKKDGALLTHTDVNMRRFFMSVDWLEWWEEFYLALKPNGTRKWLGVRSFAKAHSENEEQQRFIEYYIGPNPPVVDFDKKWQFVEPQDWYSKRETGGWCSPDTLKTISQSVAQNVYALAALRDVGQKVTTKLLVRYAGLADQLDREMGGAFFAPDLSFEDNQKRAKLYLMLHREILALQDRAQDMFAKNQGINFATDGITQLMLGARAMDESADPQKQRVRKVLDNIIDMTLMKSASHDNPLPEDVNQKIVGTLVPMKKPN